MPKVKDSSATETYSNKSFEKLSQDLKADMKKYFDSLMKRHKKLHEHIVTILVRNDYK